MSQRQPGETAIVAAGSTISAVIRTSPLDPLETRILLSHGLNLSRVQLITQSERALTAAETQQLSELFRRRMTGEPIAYITGEREFYGLSLQVTRDVLIPRPETELLVELATDRLPKGGHVLDMGTGSGAIAIAIAHTRPDAVVTALDVSTAALDIAKRNALRHGISVQFLSSNWYSALKEQQFDVIVANPPYIMEGDVHLSQGDLRFEPAGALTDRADGLSAIRTIVSGAPNHLKAGGWLLMEHGYDQSEAVRGLLTAKGFKQVQSWRDLAGIERATGGTRPVDYI